MIKSISFSTNQQSQITLILENWLSQLTTNIFLLYTVLIFLWKSFQLQQRMICLCRQHPCNLGWWGLTLLDLMIEMQNQGSHIRKLGNWGATSQNWKPRELQRYFKHCWRNKAYTPIQLQSHFRKVSFHHPMKPQWKLSLTCLEAKKVLIAIR